MYYVVEDDGRPRRVLWVDKNIGGRSAYDPWWLNYPKRFDLDDDSDFGFSSTYGHLPAVSPINTVYPASSGYTRRSSSSLDDAFSKSLSPEEGGSDEVCSGTDWFASSDSGPSDEQVLQRLRGLGHRTKHECRDDDDSGHV